MSKDISADLEERVRELEDALQAILEEPNSIDRWSSGMPDPISDKLYICIMRMRGFAREALGSKIAP